MTLFPVPDSWTWTTLGEIAEVVGGVTKDSKKQADPNLPLIPYLRVANVQRGYLDLAEIKMIRVPAAVQERLTLQSGDVLLNEGGDRDKIGRGWIWRDEVAGCIHQNHVFRARVIGGSIDPRLLAWYTNECARQWLDKNATQTVNLASISLSSIKRLPIPIPPLAEQRRIVDVLEDHLSRLDAAQTLTAHAATRLKALHRRISTPTEAGRLPDISGPGNAAPPLPAGVVDGRLPHVPHDWRWLRLGEIAEVVGGITKDAKKQADPSVPEFPYLRVANVQRGRLDLSHVTFIRVVPEKAEKWKLRAGDVLLNEGGDRDKLGRGWIWEDQIPECIHQNHVFRARLHEGILHPKLLAWHANAFGQAWCQANGKQSVNLASISLSKIKLMPVPIPPPSQQLELVERIEEHLWLLDRCRQAAESVVTRAAHLRRALLAEAFGGRLVGQDPSDEPASALLERIAAERESATAPKAGRRPKARSRDTDGSGSLDVEVKDTLW